MRAMEWVKCVVTGSDLAEGGGRDLEHSREDLPEKPNGLLRDGVFFASSGETAESFVAGHGGKIWRLA